MRWVSILTLLTVFTASMLVPGESDARRRRRRIRKRVRVAVVPVAGTGRRARKVAWKVSRKIVRKLRRGKRRKVKMLSRRRAAKLHKCLQEKECVQDLGRRLRVSYIIAGHVIKVDRSYNLDLAVISVELGGVATARSLRSRSPKRLASAAARQSLRLLRKAPKATRKALVAQAKERARKAAEEARKRPVAQEDPKLSEDPVDPKKILADQKKAAKKRPVTKAPVKGGDKGFFSSIFAKRYWAGWLTFGVSAASLGAAIAFGVTSSGAVSDAKASTSQVQAWTLRDKAEKNALLANVFFGVAGAAAIAASVLLYIEYRSERRERAKAATPPPLKFGLAPIPGGASMGLSGRF